MRPATVANVCGAFARAVTDDIDQAVTEGTGEAATIAAALVHLSKYQDETIDGLRKPLGLSHPGCVRLVDRLEAGRLVVRAEGADRRTRALRLTSAGADKAKEVLHRRSLALRRALGTLTQREQQVLAGLVGKVLTALVDDEAHALRVCRVCDYDACPSATCPVASALHA
jgi:DNA-binding MarR family transcriptional regulator